MQAEYHQQDRPPLKTQYYIEVPKNQTVNEGDTILLRCQVGNRQGVVQWTRNGFAMGKFLYTMSLNHFWAENLNKLFTDLGGKFKFSTQDSDLEYLYWQCKNPDSSDCQF